MSAGGSSSAPGTVHVNTLEHDGDAFFVDGDNGSDSGGDGSMASPFARAMIAAAKADGQIDTQESQAILNQINGLDLPADDKAFLFEEYGRPLDIVALASGVDSREHAAEVYTASALMVEPSSPPEGIFLDTLARALGLEGCLAQQIQATVAANRLG